MVEAGTRKTVPLSQARKALEVEPGVLVVLTQDELDQSDPEPSRIISVKSFVPRRAIDAQLYDRPYYLGPEAGAEPEYFALAQAIERKQYTGIATWVMRSHSYLGALVCQDGYLMLNTLRHAEEIVPFSSLEPPQGPELQPKERELALKLIEALSSSFDPESFHDTYEERVQALVEAKRQGKKLKPKRAPRRPARGTLADALEASLRSMKHG
jgi:DNA end-binding protein Ku